jgi:hypothetical protein
MTSAPQSSPPQQAQILKYDTVGWCFVKEYYNFLNKEPGRLHCFYGTESTSIMGNECQGVKSAKGMPVKTTSRLNALSEHGSLVRIEDCNHLYLYVLVETFTNIKPIIFPQNNQLFRAASGINGNRQSQKYCCLRTGMQQD